MTNTKNAGQVGMLLSAISSTVTYNDRAKQIALIDAGLTWANATDDAAERAAWSKVEIAAEWLGGFSDE